MAIAIITWYNYKSNVLSSHSCWYFVNNWFFTL